MPSHSVLPSSRVLWAVFAAFVVLWFAGLDSRRLVHPDEGRYAEIAREMVVSGDWATPRLDDFKYFEKPPLQYWATAIAYEAFGIHEWTARLWPALAGFLAIVAIGYAGWALGGGMLAAFAAMTLAGTVWHAGLAHILTLDSGIAFFLALGFSAFVVAQRPAITAAERRGWMWLVWAAMAGATLSKGLIGVALPGGALIVYSAITRDFALWRRLHLASGLLLLLLLTAPWFIVVARANDEFLHFFFIHEHVERFLTTEHGRSGPWYYFIPVFGIGILPWLTVLAGGAWPAWREGRPNALGFSWQRFALVWAAFVFVFFSASGSKLSSYILPMFAPLALVIGSVLVALPQRRLFRLLLPLAASGMALSVGLIVGFDRFAPHFASRLLPLDALIGFGAWLKAALVVTALGSAAATYALAPGRRAPTARFWGVAAVSFSMLATLQVALAGFDAMSPIRSTSAILRAAQALAPFAPAAPFYQIGMYDQTVPYYLGRTNRLVAYRDELGLGIDAEPSKQLSTLDEWYVEWTALAQGYALMPPELYATLTARGIPMRLLASDPRRVVVSRQ